MDWKLIGVWTAGLFFSITVWALIFWGLFTLLTLGE
jgi:hypothetical protein